MAPRKKAAEPAAEVTEESSPPKVDELVALAKAEDGRVMQSTEDATPGDGDLCLTKVFDPEKGKTSDGPVCIFDAHRGVYFQSPEFGGGSIVGPRRDNYKAARIRNVVAFSVVVKEHDPAPEPDTIIDHRGGLDHASSKPPQIRTPALGPD